MNIKNLLEQVSYDEHCILLCPNCKGNYLHHDIIEIFTRTQEDSPTGLHFRSKYQEYGIDDDMGGNPSDRRDGLIVGFYCEECDYLSFLSIAQHKGQTFLRFYAFPKPKSHKERYHEYLDSPEWDEKRREKLKEAGYRCQLCNSESPLSVHHRTYDRVFNELPEDLIALCIKCHEKFHDISEV